MGKHKHRFEFRSMDFVTYIWSRRKLLGYVAIFSAVFSLAGSYLIKPRFESSVVMFPASSASVSKTLLATNGGSKEDILQFGGEEEGEQLMQILYSTRIRNKVVEKFHLAHHYNIDTTKKYWHTRLFDKYKDNVAFRRTEYMSVIVNVLDTDPEMAAQIANEISNQVDSVMTLIQHERARQAFLIVKKEYDGLVTHIAQLEDSLKHIRELGIIDYKTQARVYTNAYARALEKGNRAGANVLEGKLSTMAKYGGVYVTLHDLLKNETERLTELEAKYMEAKVNAEQTIPHKFVVDKAEASEKKTYPKRLLIVFVSAISSLFLALLLLVISDRTQSKSKD